MTAVDLIILGFTLLMAIWGYTQGLVVGALSFAGFAGGGLIGTRLGPVILEEGARSPYAPLFALLGALAVGAMFAAVGEVVGFGIRRRLGESIGLLDGAGGAALVACVGLLLAWIVGAFLVTNPGTREVRREVRRSEILQALNETLPPSGPILRVLARFDPLPSLRGPGPGVGPPNPRIARDPDVRQAGQSVVRVLGTACGLGIEGSGWVAPGGRVVTNAHVVAGQDDTTVRLRDGSRHSAHALVFDPRNDVAVLRAAGVAGVPALDLREGTPAGTSAAILGYPEGGPFDVRAGRVGRTRSRTTQDAYGRGPVRRRITSVRGRVRPGNSGGPMVDGGGRVVATIFGAALDDQPPTGFAVPNGTVRDALAQAVGGRVGTGPCAR